MSATLTFPAGACALAAALVLAGCGQKGPLTLPAPPAGVQRATLPDIIRSSVTGEAAAAPASPSSAASSAPRAP